MGFPIKWFHIEQPLNNMLFVHKVKIAGSLRTEKSQSWKKTVAKLRVSPIQIGSDFHLIPEKFLVGSRCVFVALEYVIFIIPRYSLMQ